MKTKTMFAAAAALLTLAACSDSPVGPDSDPALLAAFSSVLYGYNNTASSFAGGPNAGMAAWSPGRRGHDGGRHFGFMMGGGLGGLFLGEGFGPGFGHGRFGDESHNDDCAFDADSGRVVCQTETRNGLTIARTIAFADAAGNVQSAFDSTTTNTINTRIAVSGTATRRDNVTSEVEHASDRTVSGLASGSAQRTINGTSAGTETSTGSDSAGDFTVHRVMGDTTTNVLIPAPTADHAPLIPTGGTVIRSMQVSLTRDGQTTTSSRREVVTFDGSTTATVVITQDGVTRTCTVELPRGRLNCPSA